MSAGSFLRGLDWSRTIRVAVFRAIAASLVWAIVFTIFDVRGPGGEPFNPILAIFVLPFTILLFILPLAALAKALARAGVPLAGAFSFFWACLCAVGDPLVWIFHKIQPAWVGVENFGFFNPSFLFVLKQGSEPPQLA